MKIDLVSLPRDELTDVVFDLDMDDTKRSDLSFESIRGLEELVEESAPGALARDELYEKEARLLGPLGCSAWSILKRR